MNDCQFVLHVLKINNINIIKRFSILLEKDNRLCKQQLKMINNNNINILSVQLYICFEEKQPMNYKLNNVIWHSCVVCLSVGSSWPFLLGPSSYSSKIVGYIPRWTGLAGL